MDQQIGITTASCQGLTKSCSPFPRASYYADCDHDIGCLHQMHITHQLFMQCPNKLNLQVPTYSKFKVLKLN